MSSVETINKFEDRSIEMIKSKEQKEKIMKKIDKAQQNCGKPEHISIHVMWVSEGEERKKQAEKIFFKITAQSFTNLMKGMNQHIQEAQQNASR